MFIFPVQLTTSRIGNHTPIDRFSAMCDGHTYIPALLRAPHWTSNRVPLVGGICVCAYISVLCVCFLLLISHLQTDGPQRAGLPIPRHHLLPLECSEQYRYVVTLQIHTAKVVSLILDKIRIFDLASVAEIV